MSERWRDAFTFDYYDLSRDDAAWDYTALDDDDMIALRRAGFRPLGVLRAVLRSNARYKVTSQVWVSADRRVTADGGELATLFEDGTIVKTNTPPEGAFFDAMYWKVHAHPSDRRPYTFTAGPLSDKLAAHLERVVQFEKESPVVPFESMTQYFAVRLRDAELRIVRQRREEWMVVPVTGVLAMGCAVAALLTWKLRLPHRPQPRDLIPALVLLVLAFLIAAVPVAKVMSTWIAPRLARLRPGPPRRPAADWIECAREIRAGSLEDT
jgi:hypothetical protein